MAACLKRRFARARRSAWPAPLRTIRRRRSLRARVWRSSSPKTVLILREKILSNSDYTGLRVLDGSMPLSGTNSTSAAPTLGSSIEWGDTAATGCKSANHLTTNRLPTLTPPMALEVLVSAKEISSGLGSRLGADWVKVRSRYTTNRMVALVTASQIASASAASFFCRLT
jgi:hypothetical protein